VGFLDKAKSFLGGHGVKVRHVAIERQDPASVSLPIGDGVVKGTFAVSAEKPCRVLAMRSEVMLEIKHPDGRVEQVSIGRDVFPEPNTSRSDEMLQYPYELASGQEVEDYFNVILDGSIEAILAQRQLSIGGDVRLFVRTLVDVEGSPFDPECSNDIAIAP
jgi:hypothetical protein